MVIPITNDQEMTSVVDSKVGTDAPSKVAATSVNSSLKSQDSNPYADTIARLEKEKAELQQKLNELIDEKDKLKEEYSNATWYDRIGIGIKLGAKAVQILFTAAQVERLTARIKEYSSGGPIF